MKTPHDRIRTISYLASALTGIAVIFVLGELSVRLFCPQASMYPRMEYSPEYGFIFPKNATIVDECPRKWKFTYTTNENRSRGAAIPPSDPRGKRNIIVLGDSNSFGIGVNDGEEYPAILARALGDRFNVINLSCAGWGLTQHIRRYGELGRLYAPAVVVLQFYRDDPVSDFENGITAIDGGRFVFHNTTKTKSRIARFLSRSYAIQQSQLYCFFRNWYLRLSAERKLKSGLEAFRRKAQRDAGMPPEARFYCRLLELFAQDLHRHGVKLSLLVPEGELGYFPSIGKKMSELESNGLLHVCDATPWFEGITDYGSPEGHEWGAKAHSIAGKKLSEFIMRQFSGQ